MGRARDLRGLGTGIARVPHTVFIAIILVDVTDRRAAGVSQAPTPPTVTPPHNPKCSDRQKGPRPIGNEQPSMSGSCSQENVQHVSSTPRSSGASQVHFPMSPHMTCTHPQCGQHTVPIVHIFANEVTVYVVVRVVRAAYTQKHTSDRDAPCCSNTCNDRAHARERGERCSQGERWATDKKITVGPTHGMSTCVAKGWMGGGGKGGG